MNIYSPEDIELVMSRLLGNEAGDDVESGIGEESRQEFIAKVGQEVAAAVTAERGRRDRTVIFAGSDICGAYALETAISLHRLGEAAEVYLINIGGNRLTPDCRAARERFVAEFGEDFLFETTGLQLQLPDIDSGVVVVDGLFGHEHSGPLMGGYQHLARFINESDAFVVSIDLPSGMSTDLSVGMINRNIIHADVTLTLVGPTAAFYMPENAELLGRWRVLPVITDRSVFKDIKSTVKLVEARHVKNILPERDRFASKADLGDAILFAGSYGMLGAAVLATRAALRSGCGKVTCFGPRCGFFVMQTSAPCAMYETDGSDMDIHHFELSRNYDGIGIGPGIGRSDATVRGLESFLKAAGASSKPLVLDADALNCIALRPAMLDFVPVNSVLTPHPGEFDRLFGTQPSSAARLLKAVEMARKHSLIIVLKGHYTATVWPDGSVILNSSGTEALATAGSGDVLTGLLTGFIAQGIHPAYAAVAAVYIHGLAGHMARNRHGVRGVTAEDLTQYIGMAIEAVVSPNK